MKHVLKISVYLTIAGLVACSDKKGSEKAISEKQHDHAAMEQPANENRKLVFKDSRLNAIYLQYLQLTEALINNDLANAKIAANAIEAGAREIDGASILVPPAGKILSAANIETQRSAFAELSTAMERLIKKQGLSGGELYIDFCPMALNDKGATWISTEKEIRNPYFGEVMMNCGDIQETIRP